ncbi:hypothetical protein Krac_10231 [Ktedonobacter racemifer DSM 44963]|uniref:Uncharacterized protein n=1 Tax=Ktedonobacter racemifer DSM 44963 TaxID=485913 RepID=D6TG35_KTERA|nr:hypothetical protein Krac_10231 [Ktedonobacter racemifer DSM 44963]
MEENDARIRFPTLIGAEVLDQQKTPKREHHGYHL